MFTDENGSRISSDGSSYSFVSSYTGFGTRGLLNAKLPAGKYKFRIVNQAAPTSVDLALNFYASEEMPSIPVNDDGEPKPPVYDAANSVVVKSTGYDRGGCDGTYKQDKQEPFGNW